MKRLSRIVVLLLLVALMAAPVAAQDREKKKRKHGQKQRGVAMAMMKKLEKANLTPEQKEKIKKIVATYQPKLKGIGADFKPSSEQREAMKAAREKAVADGKKGKELREAVSAALNLTDAQKEARKKQQTLMREMQKEISAVLTPEQLKQIRPDRRKDRAGKAKGKHGKKHKSDK